MGRAERITSAVKAHDSQLYCERNMEGKRVSSQWVLMGEPPPSGW